MDKYLERRSETRLYYQAHVTIEKSSVCFIFKARLANFSGKGLYFETDLLLPSGAKVCIGIHDPSHMLFSEDYVKVIVEIIWQNRLTQKPFKFGYGAKRVFLRKQKI